MSEPTQGPINTSVHHRLPEPVPPGMEISSTYLSPADPSPSDLTELGLVELHVLHSRLIRQLDREYCIDPDGPHPVTLDRIQELVAEVDIRQELLDSADPVSPGEPRFPKAPASWHEDRSGRPVAVEAPRPATGDRAITPGRTAPNDRTALSRRAR